MCKSILLELRRPIYSRRTIRCRCKERYYGLHIVQLFSQLSYTGPQLNCCFRIPRHIVKACELSELTSITLGSRAIALEYCQRTQLNIGRVHMHLRLASPAAFTCYECDLAARSS
jgi:hypothetical protein